jgi:hypothetical protein
VRSGNYSLTVGRLYVCLDNHCPLFGNFGVRLRNHIRFLGNLGKFQSFNIQVSRCRRTREALRRIAPGSARCFVQAVSESRGRVGKADTSYTARRAWTRTCPTRSGRWGIVQSSPVRPPLSVHWKFSAFICNRPLLLLVRLGTVSTFQMSKG